MRIKEMRERRGMSQAQLADYMGVCRATACRWESGKIVPSTGRVLELAELLGCSTDELYGRAPPRRPEARNSA